MTTDKTGEKVGCGRREHAPKKAFIGVGESLTFIIDWSKVVPTCIFECVKTLYSD